MIKFIPKLFSEESDNITFTDNFKNFYQKDIDNFFKWRGNVVYEKQEMTDNKSVKLNSYKRGKYNKSELDSILKKGIIINSPISHKDYNSKDFVRTGKDGDNYEKDLDLVVKIHNGFIEFPEFDYYGLLTCIFPKYRKPDSTWHFRFVEIGSNSPKPILTVPTKSSDWVEIIQACTEYLSNLKLFLGSIYNIIFVDSKSGNPRESLFSSTVGKVISALPLATSFIYRKFVAPIIASRTATKWDRLLKVAYSPGLQQKVLDYAESNYKDKLLIGNIGSGSYFVNLTMKLSGQTKVYVEALRDPEMLEKYNINPDRLRCELDYHARAVRENKDCICYCDNDPLPAIAHEIGHFMENHEEVLGSIQRASHSGIFSDSFVTFSGFILGCTGAIGEVAGIVTGILLKTPTLLAEFKASYYGLEILKRVGATDRDLQNAKESLKTAYSTYVNYTVYKSMGGSMWGRLAGDVYRGIRDKNKVK